MLYTFLLVIHVFAAIGLIGLVLLQHGKGADAGAAFGSGASQTVFGARGSASFLTRATGVLAAVFFTTSLSLAYLSTQRVERRSVTEHVETVPRSAPRRVPADAPPLPQGGTGGDVPAVPRGGAEGDVPVAPQQ
jgi:preprotein translocase subunit SecG